MDEMAALYTCYCPEKKKVIKDHMEMMESKLEEKEHFWHGYSERYSAELFKPLADKIVGMKNAVHEVLVRLEDPDSEAMNEIQTIGSSLHTMYFVEWQKIEDVWDSILEWANGFTKEAIEEIKLFYSNPEPSQFCISMPDEYFGGSHPLIEFMNHFRMNHIFEHPDYTSLALLFSPNANETNRFNGNMYDGTPNPRYGLTNADVEVTPFNIEFFKKDCEEHRYHSNESLAETDEDEVWREFVTLDMAFPPKPKFQDKACGTDDGGAESDHNEKEDSNGEESDE